MTFYIIPLLSHKCINSPTTRLFVYRLTQTPHYREFVRGISLSPKDSPHKGPVVPKAAPCSDVLDGSIHSSRVGASKKERTSTHNLIISGRRIRFKMESAKFKTMLKYLIIIMILMIMMIIINKTFKLKNKYVLLCHTAQYIHILKTQMKWHTSLIIRTGYRVQLSLDTRWLSRFVSGHSVCWRFGVWDFPALNHAFNKRRQLVSFRFENRLSVAEHQN